MIDTSAFIRETDETYHGKAKKFLSSHRLADFRKCPQFYMRKQLGLIPDEDRPAYLLGRATHTLILEGGEAFEKGYAVGGPINEKTGKPYGHNTKAFSEWAEAQGRPVVTDTQYGLIVRLANAVKDHDFASGLLSRGMAEGVVRTQYRDIECQGRLDWFSPEKGIVDLKTADDLTWFESDARRYGYAHQMAFYRAVTATALGVAFTDIPVHIIGVEKREPFRCGVWRMGMDVLGIAQKENEEAIERLKGCVKTGMWETGYEEPREFDWL